MHDASDTLSLGSLGTNHRERIKPVEHAPNFKLYMPSYAQRYRVRLASVANTSLLFSIRRYMTPVILDMAL